MGIMFNLVFLFFPIFLMASDGYINLADIGFQNSDEYIGIKYFNGQNGFEYEFSVCKTSTGSCLSFNDCRYKESELIEKIELSNNENFKKEMAWIFMRSGKTFMDIAEFYSEFSNLLLRVKPGCKLPKLSPTTQDGQVRAG